MKKFIQLLRTTLRREIKTSVGYTLFELLVIICSLVFAFRVSVMYLDYRREVEELRRIDNIKIELYEGYLNKEYKE